MDTILLSPLDNIVVLTRSMEAGGSVGLGSGTYTLEHALGLGHKLACQDIGRGEKIFKYGAPIGSATRDIAEGEHVHLHNMKSDYLPTFTLEEGREFHGAK